MTDQNPVPYDVIIAGAGPVGLFLACELRLAGLTVLILERAKDPHTELKQLPFGLRGLSATTIEALDRRGLLEDLLAAQRTCDVAGTAHWSRQTNRPGGHFAGIQFQLDDVDTAQWPYRLPGPAGTSLAVTMDALETVLAARASAMGADIRRGLALESFEATDEGVTIRAGGHSFVARWLVGCDGGRSIVRKLGGFEFVGTEPEFTGYSAEVELANPGLLSPGRHYTAAGMYT
jgi:2-polyprenyl-6-methoxyphenol hydroxylase-like FAD-dependent oxidoreductase